MINFTDKIIRWSFYLLFFLVPLVFYSKSYELFEYNKMMLTYALTIVIVAAWIIKAVSSKQLIFRRTFLDIPIFLYLGSHILSTIFSIDTHVSIWGYYSRFHEGLLATISYILLYYAAVSNLNRKDVIGILMSSFISGIIVSIWGAMEHFGGSLSCLFITGNFDDSCWVQDVKNRVFATLGQPNWMAAYLDVLLLSVLGFLFSVTSFSVFGLSVSNREQRTSNRQQSILLIALSILYFIALLFTKSRSGFLGLLVGGGILFLYILWGNRGFLKLFILSSLLFLISSFLFGLPFPQIENYSLEHYLETRNTKTIASAPKPKVDTGYIDIGISESGDIRRIVWQGAIQVWKRYPTFGSGVETFAYAYYKDRPVAHNMVSEWDFLYNKAHNEFLNILATTGTVGVLAFLSILVTFFVWFMRMYANPLRINANPSAALGTSMRIVGVGLFAAWMSILVTNFFGFSVVIIGLFFFLIPAFCFLLTEEKISADNKQIYQVGTGQWLAGGIIGVIVLIMEINLLNMWTADKAYAYGKNLDSVSQYAQGYSYLKEAVDTNSDEPTFRDELSLNEAVLAQAAFEQINSSSDSAIASLSAEQKLAINIPQLGLSTGELVNQSIDNSNKAVGTSPQALPFWKTRTKVFYSLSNIDRKYLSASLQSIQKAAELAPTDAKVHYNLGILLGQAGLTSEAIRIFEETVNMKPDYRDAHYALGLYYEQAGRKEDARKEMEFIVKKIAPDEQAEKWLRENHD